MPDDSVPHIDKVAALAFGEALLRHADTLRLGVGGATGHVADVPYDWFDLQMRIARLADACERFDLRLANAVAGLGDRAVTQVLAANEADAFPAVLPLPASAR